MAETTDTILKTYFEAGDVPTQSQFVDPIDSKVNKPVLASTAGAVLVGVEDSAGNLDATTVEAALAEVVSNLASTTSGKGADLVAITTPGGGTVTVQDKLNWIDPREYGAVGDGVTDDTTSLQSAITAAGR